MSDYKLNDLREEVGGVYAKSLDERLNRLLVLVEEEEALRGNDLSFQESGEAIDYVADLLGEYKEPVRELLKKTLEIKTLLPQIFPGNAKPNAKTKSKVSNNKRKKTSTNKNEERKVSIVQGFRDEFARRGLSGKELESRAQSCASHYRKKPELRKLLRINGKLAYTRDYSKFREVISAFVTNVLDKE